MVSKPSKNTRTIESKVGPSKIVTKEGNRRSVQANPIRTRNSFVVWENSTHIENWSLRMQEARSSNPGGEIVVAGPGHGEGPSNG